MCVSVRVCACSSLLFSLLSLTLPIAMPSSLSLVPVAAISPAFCPPLRTGSPVGGGGGEGVVELGVFFSCPGSGASPLPRNHFSGFRKRFELSRPWAGASAPLLWRKGVPSDSHTLRSWPSPRLEPLRGGLLKPTPSAPAPHGLSLVKPWMMGLERQQSLTYVCTCARVAVRVPTQASGVRCA